jgi:hypothetical protein
MSSASEIENAVRGLPSAEARASAQWMQNYLAHENGGKLEIPGGNIFAKWRGRGHLTAGKNTGDYLRLTRNANGS